MKEFIENYLKETADLKRIMLKDEKLKKSLLEISEEIVKCYKRGGKVLIAGNGGSAGDAQHIAGELVNKFFFDRPPLACIALTTDSSILTAVGNDFSFDKIFVKQLQANAKKGDVFIGISTSGNSENIVEAMKLCRQSGIINVGLMGDKQCEMDMLSDHKIKIPHTVTPHIQEGHIVCYHIICAVVEEMMFGKNKLEV